MNLYLLLVSRSVLQFSSSLPCGWPKIRPRVCHAVQFQGLPARLLCVYTCPPLFIKLARRWEPGIYRGKDAEHHEARAKLLRRRFWQPFASVACVIAGALVLGSWYRGGLGFDRGDWPRVLAVVIALTATLGRGGWAVTTWKGMTVIERIDRGMFVVGQLGAAALAISAGISAGTGLSASSSTK